MSFDLTSNLRYIAVQLLTLNDDLTVRQDLSSYFITADTVHTDELKSHTGNFTVANPAGVWDKFSGSNALAEDAIIVYKKGYSSSPGGTITWYDQFYGRITRANPSYVRTLPTGQPLNNPGEVIQITAFDLLKNPIRQKITSDPYYNWQINEIATDILVRYANLTSLNLFALDRMLEQYQALDQSIIDILSILYDLPLYYVWINYGGALETYPRLGSGGALTSISPTAVGAGYTLANTVVSVVGGGGTGALVTPTITGGQIVGYVIDDGGDGYTQDPNIVILGDGTGATAQSHIGGTGLVAYPDATAAPTTTPDFTFTDANLIVSIDDVWQDFEFINQIRVLGFELAESTALGAYQLLANEGDINNPGGFITPGGGHPLRISFSDTGNLQNIVTAKNVYLKFFTVSLANLGAPLHSGGGTEPYYAYLVFGGTGSDITNIPVCSDESGSPFFGQPFPAFGPFGAQFSEPWGVTWERPDRSNAPTPSLTWVNGSGGQEGGVNIAAQSDQGMTINLYANSDAGGFGFRLEVWGQPIIISQQTLTKILDYNPTFVNSSPTLTNAFGDNQTYQFPQAPLAMGTPVEIQVNPSTLLNTTLANTVNVGDQNITLNSVVNLAIGYTIRLGASSNNNVEYPVVENIVGTVITLSAPAQYQHPKNDQVIALGGLDVNGQPYLGVVSADNVYQSNGFQVDFERGRAEFTTRLFLDYSADTTSSLSPFFATGGTPSSWPTRNFTLIYVQPPGTAAPLSLYQTLRGVSAAGTFFNYTFKGLSLGVGYNIRLHLADPIFSAAGKRVFNVFANGLPVATGVDIVAASGGSLRAFILDINGVAADDTGTIELQFGGSSWGVTSPGNPTDLALVNGIEVFLSQGGVGVAYAINCGGPAITPTPPTVVSPGYAYSPVQQRYGINNIEVDDPLLKTIDECTVTGQYLLNQIAWARNALTVRTASIPTIKPARMIKIFHPRIGPNGADMWLYVQSISRHTERLMPTISPSEGLNDYDEYSCFLLYVQNR